MVTRADKILIGVFLTLNMALFAVLYSPARKGSWVVVEVNQKEVQRLPLTDDRILHVHGLLGETEVEIHSGKARILRSPCSRKLCIKSGYIQYADRLAACLPNRVVVRILGESQRGVDAVVS